MTKHRYTFVSGESFEADLADLLEKLVQYRQYILNYQEMLDNIDDGAYVARGNGFCATQYSEDFLDAQIQKYQSRIQQLTGWIGEYLQTKLGLRSYIRLMKKRHTPEQLDEESAQIMALLESTPQFQKAQTVMMYSSLPEVAEPQAHHPAHRGRRRHRAGGVDSRHGFRSR